MRYAGKMSRSFLGQMSRDWSLGRKPSFKKAVVKLAEGDHIDSTKWAEERAMAIKKFRPVTPGSRFRSIVKDTVTTRKGPEKSLTEPLHSKGGRNHHGRITVRRRGGGHKRRYRRIDFRRNKVGVTGRVAEVEYDPNRSANIALIHYADGEKRYIIHVRGLAVGDEVVAGGDADIKPGNALPIGRIPLGTIVHNVELKPGKGGQMARSAGAGVQIMAKEGDYVTLRSPPRKSGGCAWSAWPPLARSETPTTS